jgi:hypothetical protein
LISIKPKLQIKERGISPKLCNYQLPFYIKTEETKVYREEDVRMAMQIAAAILIICFIVSRF